MSQRRLAVVRYRSRSLWLLALAVVAVTAMALIICYRWGYGVGLERRIQIERELPDLRRDLEQQLAERLELQRSLDNALMQSKVQSIVRRQLRVELAEKESTVQALRRDIGFYRRALEPGDEPGLSIYGVDVVAMAASRRFHYQVTLLQKTAPHKLLRGGLRVYIIGSRYDEPSELALKEVSEGVNSEAINLSFKYFQNIVGEMTLPQNFEPTGLRLVVRVVGKSAKVIDKTYPWPVEESI